MAKITVKKIKTIALTIHRPATRVEHFVYVAVANKPIKYPSGAISKIVYICETKKGASRLASSAAERAYLLDNEIWGVTSLTYYIIVPQRHGGVKSWEVLETALLSEFKFYYGDVPKGNKHGTKYNIDKPNVKHARKFFTDDLLKKLIEHYSHIGD